MSDPDPATPAGTLTAMRRAIAISIGLALLAAVAVYATSLTLPKTYVARATLYAADPAGDAAETGDAIAPPRHALQIYVAAATTDAVLQQAATVMAQDANDAPSTDRLRRTVTLTTQQTQDATTGLIHITAEAGTRSEAARTADAVMASLRRWDARTAQERRETTRQRLAERLAALEAEIETLDASTEAAADPTTARRIAGLRDAHAQLAPRLDLLDAGEATGALQVFAPARAEPRPTAPNPRRNGAVAFALALLLSYGVFLARRLEP